MDSEEGYLVNVGRHQIYISEGQARAALAVALAISTILFAVFLWFYLSPLCRARLAAGRQKAHNSRLVSTGSWVNGTRFDTQAIRLLDSAKDIEGGDCGCDDITCPANGAYPPVYHRVVCIGKHSSQRESIPIIVTALPPGLSPTESDDPSDTDSEHQWDLTDTMLHPPTVKARNVADAISHPLTSSFPTGIRAHIVNPSAHRKSFFAAGSSIIRVAFPGDTSEKDPTGSKDDEGQPHHKQ